MNTRGNLRRLAALVIGGALVAAVALVPAGAAGPVSSSATDLSAALSHPVEDPYYPAQGEPYFDALKYSLNLDWRPATKRLRGTANIRFRVTTARTKVRLDLGAPLSVSKVVLDGNARGYAHSGNHLVVWTGSLAANTRHTLVIAYAGSPRQVPAPVVRGDISGLGWKTRGDGSVWAMQEPWGALTWYPVNDHPSDKAYYAARITARGGMNAVFNGRRDWTATRDGVTSSHWTLDQPAASYLITIAIGHYQRTTDTGPHGLPVTYWVPQGAPPAYLRLLRRTPADLRWLESRLGRYPFARAGAVVVPADSAMETQTLITLGQSIWSRSDRRAVVVHEYTHQWFGDTVTNDNWKDLWLNEGLTMYVQALWAASHGGPSVNSEMSFYASVDNQMREQDGPPGEYKKDHFASSNVYYSPALMLHRIRQKVGDAKFFATLKAWPQQHRNRSVDRVEFEDFWSAHTGLDLHAFVDKWLTSSTTPAGP